VFSVFIEVVIFEFFGEFNFFFWSLLGLFLEPINENNQVAFVKECKHPVILLDFLRFGVGMTLYRSNLK